ncbi:MAG: Tryptophan-tRNA ligase [candidate division TM6 bacterium GW2011_GWF2_37_49]|nr:MAG: Tryptophan-tRNA ligase [candidate division TM6 bacterium GW2011_GWF2_37_49]
MNKIIFSGVQPSGNIHIGNYLGAIKQWVDLSNDFEESIYCIVDLHAITVPQDPKELRKKILEVAALYIACGIDPKKSSIFVQSDRPEHSELTWILNCNARIGELSRMTQFKDKSGKDQEGVSIGLFDYPVLMAADILLYGSTHVPVGEDQKQHVELTRDLAQRFNAKYGQTFTVPEPIIKKETARIMGLDDPTKKMSKSAASPFNYIAMNDSPDIIGQKIKRAVTDSGTDIKSGSDKPAMTNLLNIYSEMSGQSISQIESDFSGKGYGEFKEKLAEVIVAYLRPIQEKYSKLISDEEGLIEILSEGSRRIAPMAQKTLQEAKSKIGLGVKR